VDIQRSDLYEIVQRRSDLATELRGFLTGESVDNATVMNLAERYGELDGEIVYCYSTRFAEVGQTLNSTQKAELRELADALGYVPCAGAFLYSAPISMPSIVNTDFLFAGPVPASKADLNGDGVVDIYDAITLANAYNSRPGDPNWNAIADLNDDNIVDLYDALVLANNYGKTV
jgi:hypothetical protein